MWNNAEEATTNLKMTFSSGPLKPVWVDKQKLTNESSAHIEYVVRRPADSDGRESPMERDGVSEIYASPAT